MLAGRQAVTYNLGSLGLIIRLTAANLRVVFAFPYHVSASCRGR